MSGWDRWVRRLLWGYLALMIGVAALIQWTGDRWWLGTILLFGPRWIWGLPLAPLLLGALLPLRMARLGTLLPPWIASAALLAWPIMGWQPRLGNRTAIEPSDLRVLSYNIGSESLSAYSTVKLKNLRWLVDFVRADVAVFQECNASDEDLKVVFPEFDVHSGFDACLVTRYVITKTDLRDREDIRALHGSGVIDRYELLTPAGPISVLNLHLATVRKGMEQILNDPLGLPAALDGVNALRRAESAAARTWAARATMPQLIAGDFNMPQESRIYRQYWQGFGNALSDCGSSYDYTKVSGSSGIRIDHVLYDSAMVCTSAYVLSSLGGDHLPVFATLRRR
jgi:endonuclease/exonuclease/phosphatase family metal-dependent hydrolase